MIELIDLDGFGVSMFGDYFETLLGAAGDGAALRERRRRWSLWPTAR
jgi:hypothetical protein